MSPLSILDRYVLKKFLSVLLFSLLAMVTIFVAVNYVENTDKFIDRKVPNAIILEYYLNFIPHIIALTLPVDVLLASLFAIGGLARFNELTAIKASGVSIYRTLSLVLVAAALLCGCNFWVSEAVVPDANAKKSTIWQEYVDRVSATRRAIGRDIRLYDPAGMKVMIERFDAKNLAATNISVQENFGIRMKRRIDAREARWDSASASWMFLNGAIRTFEDGTERFESFARHSETALFFTPDDIMKRDKKPDEMNVAELAEFIEKLKRSGARTERWEVDYHLKFSYPLTCLIMVLFGSPIAASRKKSGAGMNIFLTLVICFSYWIVIQMGRYFGYSKSVDPISAAWAGNVLFGMLSVFVFARVRT